MDAYHALQIASKTFFSEQNLRYYLCPYLQAFSDKFELFLQTNQNVHMTEKVS